MAPSAGMLAALMLLVVVGTVQGQDRPTGLSAVHTTNTTITVHWTPPTGTLTGYEITYFAGVEDTTGTAVPVDGGSTDSHVIPGLNATVTYRVSIVSVNGATHSNPPTGPALAARGPGLAYNGTVFPNHGVISKGLLGIGEDENALYCVTDDTTCCGTPPSPDCCGTSDPVVTLAGDGGNSNGRGNWYFPNSNILPSGTDPAAPFRWYARWLTGAVLANFRGTANQGTGALHRCDIRDSTGILHQLYTCVYDDTITCEVTSFTDPLEFSLTSAVTTDPPVFTLTCASTGGPATTVTWTRDGNNVSYDTTHVLTQTVTGQLTANYSNVLTVTGREPGNYTCSVTNNRTAQPLESASLTVAAADPPSDITATRDPPTDTSITVSWSVPSTGATPTGYIIHYQAVGDAGSMTIDSGDTTTAIIPVLATELVYDITMQTLTSSAMLPSARSTTIISGRVGLYFMNDAVPNHGILTLDQIGTMDAVQCWTLAADCCTAGNTGNWYNPNNGVLTSNSASDIYIVKGQSNVFLQRNTGGTPGLYRCDIAAAGGGNDTHYVGLYNSISGAPQITSPIKFSLETSFKVNPPVFTLTCISTDGPATTVTWTRDGAAVSYNTNRVLTQTVTDQLAANYSNVLTVTGREPGNYTCSVTNDRGNDSSQSAEVQAAAPPTDVNAEQFETVLSVTWVPPTTGATPTGYVVCYEASGSLSNVTINNGSASQQTFNISQVGEQHSVTIVVLSSQLPSAAATITSTVLTAEPPTALSAVYETPTSIHVYWTAPTGSITGYEITLQSGGNSISVLVSGGVSNHTIDSGVSNDVQYSVSIVSLNSIARSTSIGPVLAANGTGLALKGIVLPNHGVINKDPLLIGEDEDALYCVTDDVTCCGTPPSPDCCGTLPTVTGDGGIGNGQGDWYFPNGTKLVSGSANDNVWYARWLTGAVLINFRGTSTTGTTGLYRCDILNSTFYACLFDNTDGSQCVPDIPDAVTFSPIEVFDPLSPQFTLTCVSTGGPATIVTWTQNGTAVSYDANHIFTQTVTEQSTATYSNVLTVTGREPGNYMCSVTSDRGNVSSQILTVEGAATPVIGTIVMNATAVTFSWTLATDGVNPTGFVLYYSGDGITPANETINSTERQFTVSSLQPGVTLSISLVALSDHLPSEAATTSVVLGLQSVRIEDPGVLTVGQSATLTCSSDFSGDMISSIEWLNADSIVADTPILTFNPITDSLNDAIYICRVTHTNTTVYMQSIALSVQVPPNSISVVISPAPVSNVAGETYSLVCSVTEDVAGLTGSPTVQWIGPDGSREVPTTGNMSNQTSSTLTLTFQPLTTSSGGLYTCLATLPSPAVTGDITANTSQAVVVEISSPSVVVTANASGTAGTPHEFLCSIMVPTAVNTSVTAEVTWFGPGFGSGRDSTTPIMSVDGSNMFTSTLQLSPLSTADAGLYTCSVTLSSAGDSTFITPSVAGNDSESLDVTALTMPEVATDTTGSSTAGEMLTLTCRVTVVEGLTVDPTVAWFDSDNNAVTSGVNVTVGSVMRSGRESTLVLEFSPLHTSHGGRYTCIATILLPEIEVYALSGGRSLIIIVQIPLPFVILSASRSGSLSAGTPLTLTCTTTLSQYVDDGEEVMTMWTGPALSSVSRINITNAVDSTPPYVSELTISPLDAAVDNGEHSCTVTVTPRSGRESDVSASTMVIQEQMLEVIALTAPVVSIDTNGSITAGDMLTLTCRVNVVEGLTVQPDVMWVDSGGSAVTSSIIEVTVGGIMRNGKESTLDLEFSPLHTLHGGPYTCIATINIQLISISDLNGNFSEIVIVQIPPPSVIISASRSGSLSAGTPLTLTCTTTLNQYVDDGEEVNTVWTGPAMTELISGSRIDITNAVDSIPPYVSELIISTLDDVVDNGDHSCTVIVTPRSGRENALTASTPVSEGQMVIVAILAAPMVAITTTGSATAGEMLTLTCRVTVVEGLTVQPDVEWTDPGDGAVMSDVNDVTVGSVMRSGSESTLVLEFSPLRTSHGEQYTCRATINVPLIDISDLSNSSSQDVTVQISIQTTALGRDGSSSLRHGDSVMFTCSVTLDPSVDTDVILTVRHIGSNTTDITNTTTAMVLSGPQNFSYRATPAVAGTFMFTCTVIATDATSSTFITDSAEGMATTIATIAIAVSILPVYTAPTDAILGENQYRAASQLTLSCQATGANGALSYNWTSSCTGGCAVSGTVSGQNVSVSDRGTLFNFLRPDDAETYTCDANDTNDNIGSASTDVDIVGIGAYVQENSGEPRVLTNNALVTPANPAIAGFHFRLQCISNSSLTTGMAVGNVISYNDDTLEIGDNNGQVSLELAGRSRLLLVNREQSQPPISSTTQGIYTCQVRDANDNLLQFNIGIYPNGFKTSPSISDTSFFFQQTVLEVNCTSTGSVASSVTWTKDEEPVEIDGTKTQYVIDRAASTYDNVLTVIAEPGETAGNYCCSVINAVGSASRCVEVTGVSVELVPDPLVLGSDGTLVCSTELAVMSIQWQDSLNNTLEDDSTGGQSLSLSLGNINDTLHNTVYTCVAATMTNDLVFRETVILSTTVPPDSILVDVTTVGSMLAGSEYNLMCTVTKSNTGLTGSPSAEWIGPNGNPVVSTTDITVESLLNDTMTSSLRLRFARLHTSFSGLYTCLGVVPSPAVEGEVTASDNSTVTVKISTPDVIVAVPTDPLFVGTSRYLTCTITVMPEVVDSNVTVEVMWVGPAVSSVRSNQSPAAELSPGSGEYQANLTLAPLTLSDVGDYVCTVTVKPAEESIDIIASDSVMVTGNITTINDLPEPIITIDTDGSGNAGEIYTLICIVDVQDGLVIPPLTEWLDSTGTVLMSANGIRLNMTFNPLNTSNGGRYNCRSTVNIPDAEVNNLSSNKTIDVIVQVQPSIAFSTSPILPDIGLPYAGVNFTLTCTVELNAAVDTTVSVSQNWTRGGSPLSVDSRVMSFPLIMTSERVYQSSITFSPLSNQESIGDSGIYSCSATLETTMYVVGIQFIKTQTITVQEPVPTSVEITDSGVSEGGQVYNLACQVTVVEGLTVEPAVDWFQGTTRITASDANYILSGTETEGTVTSRTLTFRPLRTSLAGMYECRGKVVVSSVGISDATNSSSFIVVAKAPSPSVTVSEDRGGTLYAGTTFALNCDISLDPSVDTVVTTRAMWSGPGGDISTNDSRYVISDAYNTVSGSVSNQTHRGSLMFRPLGTVDSGMYNCSVVVVEQTKLVGESEPGLGNMDITVLDLSPPNVTTTTRGNLTVGQPFTLSCTVETVDFLFIVPTIEWIQTPDKLRMSMTTPSLDLVLDPLASSDGGRYLCRASVNIPSVNVSVSANITEEVMVQIPPPVVDIASAPFAYAGTVFTLTCTIQVHANVDTPVDVTGEWSKGGLTLLADSSGCINISEATSTVDMLTYETSLTFIPLRSSIDAGEYTCSVNVSSALQTYIRPNSNSKTTPLTPISLPPPTMEYSASSGPVVVGESYSITCNATIINNVLGSNPTVQWIGPSDGVISTAAPSVRVGNVFMADQSASLDLIFSRFTATQAGMYICRGCINVPKANITDNCANITADTTLNVQCPTAVLNLMVSARSTSSVVVSWMVPDMTRGAIAGYEVELREYISTSTGDVTNSLPNIPPVGAEVTSLTITSLDGEVPYEVSVRAFIVACYGTSVVSSPFFSKEGTPSSVGGVSITREGTTMTVSWRLLSLTEARGIVTGYTVTYSVSESRRQQSNVQSVGPDTSSVEITDLDANAAYAVGVTATNNAGTSTLITSPAPPPVPTPVPTSGPSSPIGAIVGAIIAVVLAIVVIVVIVVIIVLVMRSRRSGGISIKTKQVYSPAEHSQLHELQPASLKRLIAAEEKKESYEMEEVKVPLEDTSPLDDETPVEAEAGAVPVPIPVSVSEVTDRSMPVSTISFRDHVRKMHNDRDKGFEQEYQSLGSDPVAAHQIAKMANNRPKNRFANIFPYDHSRVVLKTLPGEEGSDYINACYLDGYQRKSCYIAAQGPMPTSLGDFWRMMWENRLPNIVILTKCLEAGRRKCEKYWADSIGEDFVTPDNRLIVTTTSIMPLADFEIRTFTVKSKTESSEEPLRVTQYHFTSWPDHGVPKFATSLISFIRRVQKGHDKDSGLPLLIHCSAGVGRTGTFIVLDAMLERIKVEGSVNVYPFLTELRSKRVLMVQTLPQYVFIHDALDELITCGETDISAGQLRTKFNVMNKVIPAKGVTGFHVQFQLLDQVSRKPEEGECSDALEHFNVSKNRYEDKLPYNMSRARLRPTGDEGSEYINASFIDGYRRRNAYIAAQSPMQSTVNDFWRMMWEFKSKVMVMLCNLNEEGQDACYPYWPAKVEQTIKYGKVLVTLTSQNSDDSDDYAIRKFTIQEESKPVTEAFTVTQYHHTEWPQHSQPPSSSCLIDMMDRITKSQMNTGNRAITVLCNDGVGRTGTFICIHAQLERLKTEGVADFFQYTKSARIHRAGLVPEVSQFAYCHEVLADFVETFDNYANFKDV